MHIYWLHKWMDINHGPFVIAASPITHAAMWWVLILMAIVTLISSINIFRLSILKVKIKKINEIKYPRPLLPRPLFFSFIFIHFPFFHFVSKIWALCITTENSVPSFTPFAMWGDTYGSSFENPYLSWNIIISRHKYVKNSYSYVYKPNWNFQTALLRFTELSF